MKFVLACLLAVGASANWEDLTNKVNKANAGWKAAPPTRFRDTDDVAQLCGTWLEGHPNYKPTPLPLGEADYNPATSIPTDFDARTAFKNCSVISRVRDQSACGSCWAFGSTEAFEDSRCIATGEDVAFSPEDTAGCCSGFACGFSNGCNGGQPSAALDWMTRTGVVTGADFYEKDTPTGGCKPYTLQPCAHHVAPSTKYPVCPKKEYSIQCTKSCSDKAYSGDYASDKAKGSKAFSLRSVEGMQTAIMTTGPLAVAFTVYADFPTYKSGVYTHVSGGALGGHAVEMIGWGVEGGKPYWLIKNSWNEQWGDGGTFKILRGSNECGIENDVTGIKF